MRLSTTSLARSQANQGCIVARMTSSLWCFFSRAVPCIPLCLGLMGFQHAMLSCRASCVLAEAETLTWAAALRLCLGLMGFQHAMLECRASCVLDGKQKGQQKVQPQSKADKSAAEPTDA